MFNLEPLFCLRQEMHSSHFHVNLIKFRTSEPFFYVKYSQFKMIFPFSLGVVFCKSSPSSVTGGWWCLAAVSTGLIVGCGWSNV